MKKIKPLIVTVSFKVEVDMNELLNGLKINTNISEIKKNVGMFLRQAVDNSNRTPGENVLFPDLDGIAANLHEWDMVSSQD